MVKHQIIDLAITLAMSVVYKQQSFTVGEKLKFLEIYHISFKEV